MPKRVLFHGTSDRFLRKVMRKGLQPRAVTGISTYDEKLESSPDRIYLTDVYAIQFGMIAVQKHGGRLLVARILVDESHIEPDTDFSEGGTHRLRFVCGLKCLEQTGCCSVRITLMPDRLYHFTQKQMQVIEESASFRIETGLRHKGFFEIHQNQQENFLMRAKQYDCRDGIWSNDQGSFVCEVA